MKTFAIFLSLSLGVATLHGCGVATDSRTASNRSTDGGLVHMDSAAAPIKVGDESQTAQNAATTSEDEGQLFISEDDLRIKLVEAKNAQVAKEQAMPTPVPAPSEKTAETAKETPAKVDTTTEVLAAAKSKIDAVFAAKMREHPHAMTAEESEFIKGQLHLFIKQSVDKDTAAATATWNGITARLNAIKASKSQGGLALAGNVQVVTVNPGMAYTGYPRGGLLTTLIRAVGRILGIGVRLVAEIVSVTVPAVLETAAELVDSVFYVLI